MAKIFSACEIIEMGIQIEKNGKRFYEKLAELAEDEHAEKALRSLAAAEEDHVKVFRDIFKASCAYDPEGAYPEEYFSYMRSLASQYVFTKEGEGEKAASLLKTYSQGIFLGISFEKDSILFYEEMKKFVPASEREKIDILIENEKEHLNVLVRMKEDQK
ncbi:MAG: ferritin family protein [Candidatus Omnitrophota bacterium]